jgi:hypothetical protein
MSDFTTKEVYKDNEICIRVKYRPKDILVTVRRVRNDKVIDPLTFLLGSNSLILQRAHEIFKDK